jgi:hypothetical protein
VYFCRKSIDLSWEGDEPSTGVAEEEASPAAGATLPEASVVEGKYSGEALVFPIE